MVNIQEQPNLLDCIAYIPCYKNGNSVIAITEDGKEILISKGIKSVIKNLLNEYCIDIKSLRRKYATILDRKNIIPLPLGVSTVLIPVKVRKPISSNDGAAAYIDTSYIQAIDGDKHAQIKLISGNTIACLESSLYVNHMIKVGNIIRQNYLMLMFGSNDLYNVKQISHEDMIANKNIATNKNIITNKDISTNKNIVANKDIATNKNIITNKDIAINKNIVTNRDIIILALEIQKLKEKIDRKWPDRA